jgi:cytochrome P450
MVTFSKGIRSCVGQNLAYAEVHIVLAYLFRKYEVRLSSDIDTLDQREDMFTYILPSHGLMVSFKPREI